MSHNYSVNETLYLILENGVVTEVRVLTCLTSRYRNMHPMYLVEPTASSDFAYAVSETHLAPDEKQAFKMILQGVLCEYHVCTNEGVRFLNVADL